MKKLLMFLPLAILLAGCSKDDDQEFEGNEDVSPQWNYVASTDNYRTMTIVATVPSAMRDDCTENDQMAVFAGDEIVSVASPLPDNNSLFYLVVGAPKGDNANLSIAYYSSKRKRLYKASDIGVFQADQMIGSGLEPLELYFK